MAADKNKEKARNVGDGLNGGQGNHQGTNINGRDAFPRALKVQPVNYFLAVLAASAC